jgi:hypothetical protein
MEHLPRAAAMYDVSPLEYEQAKHWLHQADVLSIVRTTEMITAVQAGMGFSLVQTDVPVSLQPGDEALLITLSFSVLLAWAEQRIAPLPEDWRCNLLSVHRPGSPSASSNEAATAETFQSEQFA